MEEFNSEKKSDRQRKKRFYNSIRQQIEFYLGDVNLSKDRFFSKLLEESPYIDINIILQCNKIKKLTTNVNDIIKAMKKSNFLTVTEDETKIFRTVPVAPIINADDCTIYVEDLPLEVDHEWLKNVFSIYGNVVYVSVPHYKTSNKIKGFAFVQFDTPENTKKALQAFRSMNSCLSSSMEPTELRSIQTYDGEKEMVVRRTDEIKVENIRCVKTNVSSEAENDEEPQKKRRKKNPEDDCNFKTKNEIIEIKSDIDVKDTTIKNDEFSTDEKSKNEDTMNENMYEVKHNRKRKRKKKKHEHVQTYGMQILSKQDWKKLRNKYLEEQRKKMHHLKQQLKVASKKNLEKYKLSPKNDDNQEENTMQIDKSNMAECRVKYIPGVIVKLELDQPINDVKHFKNEVKRYANVEYIDVCKSNTIAYFRCSSNEAANQVMTLNKWPNMVILCGDEELAYWEKIKLDRKEKFEKKIRSNVRGKNKLIKKVEAALATHVKFPN